MSNPEPNTNLQDAFYHLKQSRLVLLIDDSSKENRCYLIAAASTCSAEIICSVVNEARGLIFVALSQTRIRELGLPMMVNYPPAGALELTVSVDSRINATTGISAADRSNTVRTLALTKSPRTDLVVPGHIFPIRALNGGVLVRLGPAEAAVDLVRTIGLPEAALMVECVNADGNYLTLGEAQRLQQTLNCPAAKLSDLVAYRLANEPILEKIAETKLPMDGIGEFRAIAFESKHDGTAHLALVKGEIDVLQDDGRQQPLYVRVQAEIGLDETLGLRFHSKSSPQSLSPRENIRKSLELIQAQGRGILVFVRHPRSGLLSKRLQALQTGSTPRKTDEIREFGIGAQVLHSLGAKRLILLGNSKELAGIKAFSLEIVDHKGLYPSY